MTTEEQIKRIELFLEEMMIRELGKLKDAGLSYMHFVLMGQAIEVLGGFLDAKPMKARGQSARRFSRAIDYLFGGKYRVVNNNYFLYDKLRNQMTHTFIPGGDLLLLDRADSSGEYRHLKYKDGKLVLIGEIFYEDLCQATARLITSLKTGKIKPKNIGFEYER